MKGKTAVDLLRPSLKEIENCKAPLLLHLNGLSRSWPVQIQRGLGGKLDHFSTDIVARICRQL